jgi:hypothetical protein
MPITADFDIRVLCAVVGGTDFEDRLSILLCQRHQAQGYAMRIRKFLVANLWPVSEVVSVNILASSGSVFFKERSFDPFV